MVGSLIAGVRVAVEPVDDDRGVDRLPFVRRSPPARRKLQGRPGRPCSEMLRPVIVLLWKVTSSHCWSDREKTTRACLRSRCRRKNVLTDLHRKST